jgi:hypothetical protein
MFITNHIRFFLIRICCKELLIIIFATSIAVFTFCSSPSDNNSNECTYTPLHIGDIRQFVDVIDSFTILCTISGVAVRNDGQEVFVEISKAGLGTSTYSYDTAFYFVRDSFLICTSIDTVRDSTGAYDDTSNYFMEQRMALEKPVDGYTWWQLFKTRIFVTEKFTGDYQSFAGLFKNVFAVENDYWDPYQGKPFNKIYYGKNTGRIGSDFFDTTGAQTNALKLAYAKIGSAIFGNLFPDRDPRPGRLVKMQMKRTLLLFRQIEAKQIIWGD